MCIKYLEGMWFSFNLNRDEVLCHERYTYILREIDNGMRVRGRIIERVIDGNTEEAYVVCWLFGKSA